MFNQIIEHQPTEHEVGVRAVNRTSGWKATRVTSNWYNRPDDERFLNLSDLLNYTRDRYENSTTAVIENRDLELITHDDPKNIEDAMKLSIKMPDDQILAPTHWSFGQIASLAKAPAGFLRTLDASLAAGALEYCLARNRSVEKIKVYHSTRDGGEMMAVNGPSYGRIPDHEVVAAVMNVAGNGTGDTRWKIPGMLDERAMTYDPHTPVTKQTTTLFGSDRDVFMFLCDDTHPIEIGKLPDGSPDYVFRGFYIWNSEVGRTTMGIAAFYLRAACRNRLFWGVEGFSEITLRHTSKAPDRFVHEARPALESFATGSVDDLLRGVEQAKAAKIASDDDDAMAFLQNRKFSRKQSRAILDRVMEEEQRPLRTVWDAAQGITAMARDIPRQDERVELERTAQTLLNRVAA